MWGGAAPASKAASGTASGAACRHVSKQQFNLRAEEVTARRFAPSSLSHSWCLRINLSNTRMCVSAFVCVRYTQINGNLKLFFLLFLAGWEDFFQ